MKVLKGKIKSLKEVHHSEINEMKQKLKAENVSSIFHYIYTKNKKLCERFSSSKKKFSNSLSMSVRSFAKSKEARNNILN